MPRFPSTSRRAAGVRPASERPLPRRTVALVAARRAVLGVVALAGTATLLGLLDRFTWFFELETFFRVQYAVVLGGLALLAAALRAWRTAALAVVFAAANVALFAPTVWGSRAGGTPVAPDRLLLLLVNVEVGNEDVGAVADLIRRTDADVVGLTEYSPRWAAALADVLRPYRWRAAEAIPSAYGIGVFSRVPMRDAHVVHLPADGPATALGTVALAGRPVSVVVTHPHTPFGPRAGGLHRRQFRALAEARSRWHRRVAICGDLNAVPWSWPFRDLAARAGLRDSRRGRGFETSWPTWAWFLRVPIDNCLVGPGLAVTRREPGPDVGSDHLPLVVELAPTALPRGAGGARGARA